MLRNKFRDPRNIDVSISRSLFLNLKKETLQKLYIYNKFIGLYFSTKHNKKRVFYNLVSYLN